MNKPTRPVNKPVTKKEMEDMQKGTYVSKFLNRKERKKLEKKPKFQ